MPTAWSRAAKAGSRVSVLAVALCGVLCGCPTEPRERPDVVCSDACKQRLVACNEHQCERGCAFVIDRLVEHEQPTILTCMMKARDCEDPSWAGCAVKVGVYADGGPGSPPHVEEEQP
jgi:hypothetical protein